MTPPLRHSRGLLLDLFGTLVDIDNSLLPTALVDGREQLQTIHDLDTLLGAVTGHPTRRAFFEAIRRSSQEVQREKRESDREISSHVRFERALQSLGAATEAHEIALEMTRRHMRSLADAVVCPQGRVSLLEQLRSRCRLALVSNFDHGATARDILEESGLAPYFDVTLVSDELGFRKPGARIFTAALSSLGLDASQCVHVGDARVEDIEGANAAGIRTAWISDGDPPPPAASWVLDDVDEIPNLLDDFFA